MQPFRIAIDPGHGGRDPGAVAGEIYEKDLNLNLSAYLFKLCLNKGLNPFLLRSGDYNLQLEERVNLAEAAGAELFLSVHHNGAASSGANGTETFHFPGSKFGVLYAEYIQKGMLDVLGSRNRGVKTSDSLYVLRRTSMPAVLIEPLFVTGEEDRIIYSRENYYKDLANGIIDSIIQLNKELGRVK